MPDIKSIEAAIELCKDESRLLGVKFGSKTVVRGEKIPKGGKHFAIFAQLRLTCPNVFT
jgi:hypothetical protein